MKSLIASLIATVCSHCLACSPNQNFDVHFAENSSELESSEILRLADWKIKINSLFPNHDQLQIAGAAEATEVDPNQLSKDRARIVYEFFQRTHYERAKITVENHVYKIPRINEKSFMRTEIMMTPLPPHPCSR
jgi:hypothetical protein